MYTYKFVFFCLAINHHIALFYFPNQFDSPPCPVSRSYISSYRSVQNLDTNSAGSCAPSSMNSCAKHKFLLLKDKDVFPKQ